MVLHILQNSNYQDYLIKYLNDDDNHDFIVLIYTKSLLRETNNAISFIYKNHRRALLNIDLSKYDKVILHGLTPLTAEFVLKNKKKTQFNWFFWGSEGYQLSLINNLYSDLTLMSLNTFPSKKTNWLIKLKTIILKGFKHIKVWDLFCLFFNPNYTVYTKSHFVKALNEIDFCLTPIYEDFLLLKSNFKDFKMEYKKAFYIPFDNSGFKVKKNTNKIILLGNSAAETNNHIDVLLKLKKYKSQINQIICPLSYGGSEFYKNYIENKGNSYFDEKFLSIKTFLPEDKWNQIIDDIDIVFFNHYRQQGFGNIKRLLMNGKKIYLNPHSTIYKMLKREGCIIFSIEDEINLSPLSFQQTLINKKYVLSNFSKNNFIENWNNIF